MEATINVDIRTATAKKTFDVIASLPHSGQSVKPVEGW